MLRFLGFFLGVVLVVLIAVAFLRGWVDISLFQKRGNESGATVTVHKAKVKQDIAALKNEVRNVKSGEKATGEKKIHGSVQNIADKSVTIISKTDRPVTVVIARETEIHTGQKEGTLADIHPGDNVTVDYVTLDDRHVAKTLRKD